MDINRSSLSQYQTNSSNTASVYAEGNNTDYPIRPAGTRSPGTNSDTQQLNWKDGQIVKGVVVDRKYNEVSLALEPDKRVITAKLSGDVPLSIGQSAYFKVTDDTPGQYMLKFIPQETASASDTMVKKVLTASSFPMTDKNKAIVTELLNNQMPVDKQTLQTMAKLAYMNRDASPATLVLMYKNNIPLTPANISQFEAYQNSTSSMLNDIHSLSETLTNLLNNTGNADLSEAIDLNGQLIDILNTASYESSSSEVTSPAINLLLSSKELNLLSSTLEQYLSDTNVNPSGLPADYMNKLKEGTLTLNDTVKLITQLIPKDSQVFQLWNSYLSNDLDNPAAMLSSLSENGQSASELLPGVSGQPASEQSLSGKAMIKQNLFGQNLSRNSISEINASGTNLSEADILEQKVLDTGSSTKQVANQIILSLLEQYSSTSGKEALIGHLLSPEDRDSLLQKLSSFTNPNELKSSIASGTATINDLLNFIQKGLSKADTLPARELIQSPVYQSLLTEAFHQRWTIKPEQLAEKDSIDKLYQNLSQDMEKINHLLSAGKDGSNQGNIQENVKNLQENLKFLNDLNQAFTYEQLPLQFKNQDVHSDLYVFTNKNALKEKERSLSVLLHLTMAHLGPINIYVKMDHNNIQTDFYIEDNSAASLISENLPTLTEALKKKGYSLSASVSNEYKKPDFTEDFIEQNSQDNSCKRYSFDIRT